ncbi:MAG: hypothetical protein ABJE47_07135 [bacterium]
MSHDEVATGPRVDASAPARHVARRTLLVAVVAVVVALLLARLPGGMDFPAKRRIATVAWWGLSAAAGWVLLPYALRDACVLFDDEVDEFLLNSRWVVLLSAVWLLPRNPDGWGFFWASIAAGTLVFVVKLIRERVRIDGHAPSSAGDWARWSGEWRTRRSREK